MLVVSKVDSQLTLNNRIYDQYKFYSFGLSAFELKNCFPLKNYRIYIDNKFYSFQLQRESTLLTTNLIIISLRFFLFFC